MPLTPEERQQRVRQALAKSRPDITDFSHDHHLPTRPVGHAGGLATSTAILRHYRRYHRPSSAQVEPQQVAEVLDNADIGRWVLMGLYGYVGYLANPRATQDVDVLVDDDDLEAAIQAIQQRWPMLQPRRSAVVVRFLDPGEVAIDGETKQVIDVMLPSNDCYRAILDVHHRLDPASGYAIPVLEAACASKFAALISPNRQWEKKQQDAVDLRSIMVPNDDRIDRGLLRQLGELVYSGGGQEILEFLELAKNQQPFPV